MDKSKVALIGCGRIGFLLEDDPLRNKPCTHLGGALSAGLTINYACDIDQNRLMLFSQKTRIPRENCYDNFKKLLNEIKPAIVIIATWTKNHYEICMQAINNQAHIIIIEKPITSSLSKGKKLLSECSKNNVFLLVNHERRYDNRYIHLKKNLHNGIIGNIKTIYASILTGPYKGVSDINEGGGPLLHDGTHLIDIIRYLFGEILTVNGTVTRDKRIKGFEDRATCWIKTVNNIDVFLEAGGSREYFIFELIISGTTGKIIIGNGYQKLFIKSQSKYYKNFNDLNEKEYPSYKKNNCFTELYKEVIQIKKNHYNTVKSGVYDGYKALEIIHAIYLSSYKKKEIKLPLKKKSVNLKKIFNL